MLKVGTCNIRETYTVETQQEGHATQSTLRNNSIVPRFYESFLKPVITAASMSARARCTSQRNLQWFIAQFYELIFLKDSDVSISLKRVLRARDELRDATSLLAVHYPRPGVHFRFKIVPTIL